MNDSVAPANIVAAALVMQFCLSVITALGAFWVRRREAQVFRFYLNPPNIGRYAWTLLVFSLATIGLLVFSDEFSSLWRPLSGQLNFSVLRWSTAIFFVFILDIICIAILVQMTGGSFHSPFAPAYFILPALAFFLRESHRHVISYTLLVAACFIFGFTVPEPNPETAISQKGAYAFVSICCLILSVVIGFMTRP